MNRAVIEQAGERRSSRIESIRAVESDDVNPPARPATAEARP